MDVTKVKYSFRVTKRRFCCECLVKAAGLRKSRLRGLNVVADRYILISDALVEYQDQLQITTFCV